MSLFSSLYTGVNGLNAQSTATSVISTNIANSTTVGFKRTDTNFHDLVVNSPSPNKFQNGGVYTTRIQRVDRQGAIQQTATTTEMGILGDGFFAVKTNASEELDFLFTRNGTFSPDANGLMRNAAGFVLYGWPIDTTTGAVASTPTLEGLEPVDINLLNSQAIVTTQAELAINLNASESSYNPQLVGGALPVSQQSVWNPVTQTSIDGSQAAHFSRDLTVVDNSGTPRNITFEFRHITGPMAQATSGAVAVDFLTSLTNPSYFAGINAGDAFTISAGGATQEYIIGAPAGAGQFRVDTIGELTNHINSQLGGGDVVDATLDENGSLIFKAKDPTTNLTFTETVGNPLTANNTIELPALNFAPVADVTVADPLINPNQADYPALSNLTDPNTNGWWEIRILKEADPFISSPTIEDPNNPGTFILNPNYNPLDPAFGQKQEISKALLNFDSTGLLNTARDPVTGAVLDGTLTLTPGIFDSGVATATLDSIPVDISRFSQFSGAYNVLVQNQNGAEAGTLDRLSIDREGRVIASFTNSEQVAIYQVPLAHFINPNGLEALTGTVWEQTADAGEVEMLAAGSGGAGIIQASAVETSNVDLAGEFADLIVSQRAFQANSRIISTVDEMTQELKSLKR